MRIALRLAVVFFVLLFLFLLLLVGQIRRKPIENENFYRETLHRIDTTQFKHSRGKLFSAWGSVNITPNTPQALAGYLIRPNFTAVHDSLFCRMLYLDNEQQGIWFVDVDLLLFPTAWRQALQEMWKQKHPNDFLYFSATHTHNGVGGWDESIVGRIILGKPKKKWSDDCVEKILNTMQAIRAKATPSSIAYYEKDARNLTLNRLDKTLPDDGVLRGFTVENKEQKKFILFVYSAHATSISKRSTLVSADYPAAILGELKKQYVDGMFMSGMVGTERFDFCNQDDFPVIDSIRRRVTPLLLDVVNNAKKDSVHFSVATIPISFGVSQLRLLKDVRLKDWAYRWLFQPLHGSFQVAQLNEMLFVSTPCDFSSELYYRHHLDSLAQSVNKKLIITSFNGDYVGYITYDGHYDSIEKEETYALNWVGPFYGNYFSNCLSAIVKKEK